MKKNLLVIILISLSMWLPATTVAQNIVLDPGFETGGVWTESSTNFGVVVCDLATCGTGNGSSGAYAGAKWVWFGGATAFEEGSFAQTLVIPVNYDTLTFFLRMGQCDSASTADFVEVKIDGNVLWSIDATTPRCNELDYVQEAVNIAAYADGNSHTLEFHSIQYSPTSGVANFSVDDLSIVENTNFSTGIASINNSAILTVTPNPATEMVKISAEGFNGKYSIAVYDIFGKMISINADGISNGTIEQTIDVRGWSRGIYFVNVQSNGIAQVRKLILN
jgi:hypothetical protein